MSWVDTSVDLLNAITALELAMFFHVCGGRPEKYRIWALVSVNGELGSMSSRMKCGKNEGSAESEVEWGDGWCEDFPRMHRVSMVTRCQIHVTTRGPHTTTIVRGRGFQQIEVGRSGNTDSVLSQKTEALLRTSTRTCARAQSE